MHGSMNVKFTACYETQCSSSCLPPPVADTIFRHINTVHIVQRPMFTKTLILTTHFTFYEPCIVIRIRKKDQDFDINTT